MLLINSSTGSQFKSGDSYVYQGKLYTIEEIVFKINSITDKEKQIIVELIDASGNKVQSNFWKNDYGKNPNIYMDGDTYKLVEISEGDTALFIGFKYDYSGYTQFNCIGGYKLVDIEIKYVPAIDIEKHEDRINKLISFVSDDSLRKTCVDMLERYYKDFVKKPAASKHHHNYIGGLIQHTAEVMSIAYNISLTFEVNRDYIIVASLFHDIMKIKEYTDDGKYKAYAERIGHIHGSSRLFEDLAVSNSCNAEDIQNIVHIILSHHGKKEWGSPVEPKTPEAVIVHEADMISSYINPIMTQMCTSKNKDYYLI